MLDPRRTANSQSNQHSELVKFIQGRALKRGSFVLSSGASSTYYIDGKLISFDPEGIWLVVQALLEELREIPHDAVGGMDMGATPIVSAFALRSFELGIPVPTFTVRKEVKGHGTKKLIEGPLQPGSRVIIVDDIVTTGESILKAIEAVRAIGCTVELAIAILDRNAGAEEFLTGRDVVYKPLVHLADLGL